jgi:hypothetical protein
MIELELTEIQVRRRKVSPPELTSRSSTGFSIEERLFSFGLEVHHKVFQ